MHPSKHFEVVEHNRQYSASKVTSKPIPPEMMEIFKASARSAIKSIAKKMPLPDYRGYPIATPHGLRRF